MGEYLSLCFSEYRFRGTRFGEDDVDDMDVEDEEEEDGLRLLVSQQSLLFIHMSVQHLEVKVRLLPTSTGTQTPAQAILAARLISFTTELDPTGHSDLLYVSLETQQFDLHVSGIC